MFLNILEKLSPCTLINLIGFTKRDMKKKTFPHFGFYEGFRWPQKLFKKKLNKHFSAMVCIRFLVRGALEGKKTKFCEKAQGGAAL